MSTARRAGAVLVVALAAAAFPGSARAHLGHVVRSAERYLKIDVTGRTLRVVVSLSLGPNEMRRVLEAADAGGDGEVTRDEANAYMETWGDALSADLPTTVDDDEVALWFRDPFVEPIGAVRAVPGIVEMVAEHALDGGAHVVRVSDRMRRDPFDRTDVAFTAREGAVLVASGAPEATTPPVETLAFGREGPTVMIARVEVPGGASPAGVWWIAAVGLAALAAIAIVVRIRGVRRAVRADTGT